MLTRTAIALAIVVSAATSALAAPKMRSTDTPGVGAAHEDWQRYYNNKYGNDWSRFRDMGDFN